MREDGARAPGPASRHIGIGIAVADLDAVTGFASGMAHVRGPEGITASLAERIG